MPKTKDLIISGFDKFHICFFHSKGNYSYFHKCNNFIINSAHNSLCKENGPFLDILTKTQNKNLFSYYNIIEKKFDLSPILIRYKDDEYLSPIKYRYTLGKNESILKNKCVYSIEDNPQLMNILGPENEEQLKFQISVLNSIKEPYIISIDNYIKYNNTILYYLYDMTYDNYINKEISEDKWNEFKDIFLPNKLKEYNIEEIPQPFQIGAGASFEL